MVKKISAVEFDLEVSSGRSVVQFSASWCPGCKTILPHFEKWSELNPEINALYVDCDENKDLPAKFGIKNIPAFVVIENGKVIQENLTRVKPNEMDEKFLKKD